MQNGAGYGSHLRQWRQRRRLSQMQLALRADISPRHLGFVELGRAGASRALVLRLAEELDLPMRERNVWLVAAGFAPLFEDIAHDEPSRAMVVAAIAATIEAHKPFPAFAIDRQWNVVASNAAIPELYDGVCDNLLRPPVNVMRLTLDPRGLAPRILNLDAWAAHVVARLRRELELTADARLDALLLQAQALYPAVRRHKHTATGHLGLMVPLRIQTRIGVLSFFSSLTVFGTPIDITLSEIALELLYPADEQTSLIVRSSAAVGL